MERSYVKGKTDKERLNSIDTTLRHFARKLQKKVIGVMPTSPVFDFAYAPDSLGVVLRRIFPARGRIGKSCVYVSKHEGSKSTIVHASLIRENGTWSDHIEVKKKPLIVDLDIDVEPGDRLEISVEDPEKVRGVWVGFLYEVGLDSLPKKDFMLDQLEDIENASEE